MNDQTGKVKTLPEAMLSVDSRRLTAVLLANGLLRIANAAGGALVSFYLAYLATQGRATDAALVGALGVVANSAELVGAVPMGTLADRFSSRRLLLFGALLGALATQLFGLSGAVTIFFLSRALEGLGAAATGPTLLAHLADVTRYDAAARGRTMSFYELSFLAGLAGGGLVAGTLWDTVHMLAFSLLAAIYLIVAGLFYWGAYLPQSTAILIDSPSPGLRRALTDPLLRRLAPAWLAVNAVVGLWLTHVSFQLSGPKVAGQALVGRFTASEVGLILLGYALIFGVGVIAWGFVLAYMSRVRVMRIALTAMFFVCLWLYLLNTTIDWPSPIRWTLLVLAGLSIMVESGFTPAALAYLAEVASRGPGRGAAMGLYTLLLGLGSALGAGLGGVLAQGFAFNGLILGTIGLGIVGIAALALLPNRSTVA